MTLPDNRVPRSDRRLEVLLSEGSSTSARQTLYALGRAYRIDVLDAASVALCRFSRYVRRWYRCPSCSQTPLDYLQFLMHRLHTNRYDVLLPTHEQAYLLARVRDHVQKYVGLALPPFDVFDRMQDKAKFVRLLDELGLPYPATKIVSTRKQLQGGWEYPCYLKLAHGTAGNAVARLQHADDMRRMADHLEREGAFDGDGEALVQQPAVGALAVIQAVFQRGRLVGSHCTQGLVQGVGGAPVSRISVAHPAVVEDIRRLGAHLQWHGPLFVEYFHDESSGGIQYLEANPRIGETLNATICGVDLCEQVIRVSLDEPVEPLPSGRIGIRSHQAMTLLLAAALQGATRRRLLAELARQISGRGLYRHSQDELARFKDDWLSVLPSVGVAAQLLVAPKLAERIVRQTVNNYSLPFAAAAAIRKFSREALDDALGEAASNPSVAAS